MARVPDTDGLSHTNVLSNKYSCRGRRHASSTANGRPDVASETCRQTCFTERTLASSLMLLQNVDNAQQSLINGCGYAVRLAQLYDLSGKNLDLGFASGFNIL